MATTFDLVITDYSVGDRVQMHPATDLWMRGACYGTVTAVGRKLLTVKLDNLARPIKVSLSNVGKVDAY